MGHLACARYEDFGRYTVAVAARSSCTASTHRSTVLPGSMFAIVNVDRNVDTLPGTVNV